MLSHIYNGTLADALFYKIKAHQKLKREKKWEICKVKGEIFQYRIFDRTKINLYTDDKLSELIMKGNFERTEQEFIRNYLRPGDIFVDVGANIGLFALIAAKTVGKQGKVFSFEPTESIYQRLLQNISLNRVNNVKCIKMALSDKEEDRILTISNDGYGAWNSLAHPTAGEIFSKEIVQCTTWDKFSSENQLTGKITLMKFDIEGWELYALHGAEQELIRNDAPDLLVEFTDINAQSAGTSCADVYSFLEKIGYKMYRVDIQNQRISHDPLRTSYPYLNLLASKRINFVSKRLGYSDY